MVLITAVWCICCAIMQTLSFAHADSGSVYEKTPCLYMNTCKYGGLAINCNSASLYWIPQDLSSQTRCLYLRNNNLTSINAELHPLKHLKLLDLGNNSIHNIAATSFQSLGNLVELFLDENLIDFQDLSKETFGYLKSLQQLNLKGNQWKTLSYRDDLFGELKTVKFLWLDGIPSGEPFRAGFGFMTNLWSLSIFGEFDYISNDTFAIFNNSNIHNLQILDTQLYDMEPLAFSHFHKLTNLSLDGSKNLGFINMSHGWYGLQFTNISSLSLQRTVPFDKEIIFLNSTFYTDLWQTNIKSLYLDKNNIILFQDSCFASCLPNLEVLSLYYNRLQIIVGSRFFITDLANMKHLKYLSASKQLRSLPDESENIISKRDIHFDSNLAGYAQETPQISQIVHDMYKVPLNYSTCPCPQPQTKSSWNDTFTMYFGEGQYPLTNNSESELGITWIFYLPPTLETLLLAEYVNEDIGTLPLIALYAPSLKYLDFSGNGFEKMVGPFLFITPSKSVNFTIKVSHNGIRYISPEVLKKSVQLGLKIVDFDISYNSLGDQLQTDPEILSKIMTDVRKLNLSGNGIDYLAAETFVKLTFLEVLDLSRNSLREVNFSFALLPQLKAIDLSNNLLSSLSKAVTSEMDLMVKAVSHFSIDLSGNPLDCSCSTLSFLTWIKTTSVEVMNNATYKCTFGEDVISLGSLFLKHYESLQINCALKTYAMAGGIAVGLISLSVAFSAVIYRHRWDLKFFFLKVVINRKKYLEAEERRNYHYDAFVIYADEDYDWVRNDLMPELEGEEAASSGVHDSLNENLIRLCVATRDFTPGTPIEANIYEKLNSSFKVLLVLTKSSVKSEWCKFELRCARMRSMDLGHDIFVVIMKDPVSARDMSKPLQGLIKQNTYIEWPTNPEEHANFWRRIKDALKALEPTPPKCECGHYVRPHITSRETYDPQFIFNDDDDDDDDDEATRLIN